MAILNRSLAGLKMNLDEDTGSIVITKAPKEKATHNKPKVLFRTVDPSVITNYLFPQPKVRMLEYYQIPGITFDYAFYKANKTAKKAKTNATGMYFFSILFAVPGPILISGDLSRVYGGDNYFWGRSPGGKEDHRRLKKRRRDPGLAPCSSRRDQRGTC